MAAKKPIKIAAPTVGYTGDLGDALYALARATSGGRRPTGVRRTRSLNPAKVGVNKALRITRPVPGQEAQPGESTRTPGAQPLPPGQLSLFDQVELGIDPSQQDDGVDRTEVLSPPNSLDPARPRALEARYDPDTRRLTVRFRNGGTYAYEGIPPATWRALKRNKSFGQTMDRLVINQYPYSKIAF